MRGMPANVRLFQVYIFVNFFTSGLYYPILGDLLNKNVPSSKRATIISIGSVLYGLLSSAAYPVLGAIADASSLQVTFKVLGCGTLVCVSLIVVCLKWERLGG